MIAVDFDGTLFKRKWSLIGASNLEINEFLDKDVNIIKQIASEFPFGTDVVIDAYIQSGCSEQETRSMLQKRLIEEYLR